jgi:hypothetical protein
VHELPTSLVLVASYVSVTAVALVTRVTNEPEGRHLAYATCVHAKHRYLSDDASKATVLSPGDRYALLSSSA